MTLFDTLDGAFMTVAYRWAFAEPVRKLYYNLTITGLAVAVALFIGTVQLVGMLHDRMHWRDPVTGWIASLGFSEQFLDQFEWPEFVRAGREATLDALLTHGAADASRPATPLRSGS